MKNSQTIRSLPIALIAIMASVGCATSNPTPQQMVVQKQVSACEREFFKHRSPYLTKENAYRLQIQATQDCRELVQGYMADVAARQSAEEVIALAQAEVKETRSE